MKDTLGLVVVITVMFGFMTWYGNKTEQMVDIVSEKYVVACDIHGNCGFADK